MITAAGGREIQRTRTPWPGLNRHPAFPTAYLALATASVPRVRRKDPASPSAILARAPLARREKRAPPPPPGPKAYYEICHRRIWVGTGPAPNESGPEEARVAYASPVFHLGPFEPRANRSLPRARSAEIPPKSPAPQRPLVRHRDPVRAAGPDSATARIVNIVPPAI